MSKSLNTIKQVLTNREYLVLIVVVLLYIGSYILFPSQGMASGEVAVDYLQEMAIIIPPVFFLMGLFEVWVPKDLVEKYMGKNAGVKGFILSFIFGTLPAGPVYVAFPIAATLYSKGARVRNIVVFLGVWAAAKLPQVMVEVQFLGVEFAAIRLLLTITFMVMLGMLIEKIVTKTDINLEVDLTQENNSQNQGQ